MSTKKLKDGIVWIIAETRFYKSVASSPSDEITIDDMEEMLINLLKSEGFKKSNVKAQIKASVKSMTDIYYASE